MFLGLWHCSTGLLHDELAPATGCGEFFKFQQVTSYIKGLSWTGPLCRDALCGARCRPWLHGHQSVCTCFRSACKGPRAMPTSRTAKGRHVGLGKVPSERAALPRYLLSHGCSTLMPHSCPPNPMALAVAPSRWSTRDPRSEVAGCRVARCMTAGLVTASRVSAMGTVVSGRGSSGNSERSLYSVQGSSALSKAKI